MDVMKKKKGFVFIETLVVIVVLLTSLLYLYSSFISLSNNEQKRLLYDDVAYLYRTYYVKKYFSSQRIDRIISRLSKEDRTDNANFILSFGCGSAEVFDNYRKEGAFCENLTSRLHISNIYLTYYDVSSLKDCTTESGLCSTLTRISTDLASYLRTLDGKGVSGYRMIVEYAEDGVGNLCTDEEHCNRYFSTIKVGDSL